MKVLDLDYLEINQETNQLQGQGIVAASSSSVAATSSDGSSIYVNIGSSANAFEGLYGSYASSNSYANGYISPNYGTPILPLTFNLTLPRSGRFQ